jgi:polo-like kinase 1
MKYMKHSLAFPAATIWVVRYVDYTSKYGLGFLLNTGSAGVYFNDSTKIVVSPDGTIFQYSERKRKDKGATSSEHSIQTHSVLKFPAELQKKVTLLRHFRNYLVDQQKGGKIDCLFTCFPAR